MTFAMGSDVWSTTAGQGAVERRFPGRTAIITGGATGIGAAYARAFALEGANVAIADLREAEGEALVRELNGRGDAAALFVRADVASDSDTRSMAGQAVARFGGIDILINNAGVYLDLGRKRPFDQITPDEWDRVMAVNVRGVWLCTSAVFPVMTERRRGKVINIASVVAYSGATGFAHYVASKAAVIGLTRALARELGPYNITVNAVAPGLVDNEATRQLNPDEYLQQAAKARALGRQMAPDDLVGAVLFLASPDSDFISGQTLIVDGGAMMD